MGSGKIDEIGKFIRENEVDIAIFDDELRLPRSGILNRYLDCRILDRTNLILDIFARRARTFPCQDTGGTGTVSVSPATSYRYVDPP